MPIRLRLILLAIISMLGMIVAAGLGLGRIQQETRQAQQLALHNRWAHDCSTLIHLVQRERGYGTSSLATEQFDPLLLKGMRNDTNAALAALSNNPLATEKRMSRSGLDDLSVKFLAVRNQADKRISNWHVTRDAYTAIINTLLSSVQFELINEDKVSNAQLDAIAELALAREALGLLRATVNSVKSREIDADNGDLVFIASELTIYRQHLGNFRRVADEESTKKIQALLDSETYSWVFTVIDQELTKGKLGPGIEHPQEWWPRVTAVIDAEKELEDVSFDLLERSTAGDIALRMQTRNLLSVVVLVLIVGLASFVWITIIRMMGDLKELSSALDEIVEKENFTIRLSDKGRKDELGHAFALFNRLLAFTDGLLREKEKLAATDALTGLMNRRSFLTCAEREISRADRYAQSLSLIFLDIDHFKRVNDRYGHHAGDEVLKTFSDLIRERIRSSDLLARWGGEEFLILAPETQLESAAALAESLREAVAASAFPSVGSVTCSLGVAQRKSTESFEAFCARADAALYQAKETGRNRVCAAA